ncbi:cupin domain-containing protein [bacterium]|nr:cupin domain-containing protein [bacterium]
MTESTLTRASDSERAEQVIRQKDIPAVELAHGASARLVAAPGATVSLVEQGPYSELPRHRHEQDKVILVLEGERDEALDGRLYHISAGDILYAPSGAEHGALTYGSGCKTIEISAPARDNLVTKLEALLDRL